MWNFILSLFQGGERGDSEAVALFMRGYSVLKVAALLHPGVGGPELEQRQRDVEAELRSSIEELAETIADLRAQMGMQD